jgi:hypothetical protein
MRRGLCRVRRTHAWATCAWFRGGLCRAGSRYHASACWGDIGHLRARYGRRRPGCVWEPLARNKAEGVGSYAHTHLFCISAVALSPLYQSRSRIVYLSALENRLRQAVATTAHPSVAPAETCASLIEARIVPINLCPQYRSCIARMLGRTCVWSITVPP